jgi:hypothetical protein
VKQALRITECRTNRYECIREKVNIQFDPGMFVSDIWSVQLKY